MYETCAIPIYMYECNIFYALPSSDELIICSLFSRLSILKPNSLLLFIHLLFILIMFMNSLHSVPSMKKKQKTFSSRSNGCNRSCILFQRLILSESAETKNSYLLRSLMLIAKQDSYSLKMHFFLYF